MTATPLMPDPDSTPDGAGSPSPPAVMTCRRPEDVLAAIPVVLGFEPSDSIVMLTFGGEENFHGRVDLPDAEEPEAYDEVRDLILEPARAHGVGSVLLVAYADDTAWATDVLRRLVADFTTADVAVTSTLMVSNGCWFDPDEPQVAGVPFDSASHRFRVESVLRGQVISPSRAELADRLLPRPGVAQTVRALRRAVPLSPDQMADAVTTALNSSRFSDRVLAGVLLGLIDPAVRDQAWGGMTTSSAAAHVALWTDAVQRSPRELVAGPAAVLALSAWLSGNGAMSWCAVDLAHEHDPHNTLARLVGELLSGAVPPSRWDDHLAGGLSADAVEG